MDRSPAKTLSLVAATLLAAACSESAPTSEPVRAAAPSAQRPAPSDNAPEAPQAKAPANPSAQATPAEADPGLYTALEGGACKLVSVDREAGGSTARCPGVGGYELLVQDSDARMSIDVVAPGGEVTPLQLASLVGNGAFSSLGAQAEWRPSDGSAPTALIVRFNAFQQPEQPERPTSYLVVARLKRGDTCSVGRVDPGPAQNERARDMARKAGTMPCLQPSGR